MAGVFAALWTARLLIRRHWRALAARAGKVMAASIGILRVTARVVIWAMVLLLVLDNIGTDITALIAGLGIGGIAVALALQNVADLLSKPLRNFGRMVERRVAFTLDVDYGTERDRLEKVPPAIRRIIEAQRDIRFDRCHFARYAPTSLQFEAVYYVTSADYNLHTDRQQAIFLAIHDAFAALGIRFAQPQ